MTDPSGESVQVGSGERGQRYYRPPLPGLPEGQAMVDLINSLRTEYAIEGGIPERPDSTGGWLSTLVWNIRNRYLAWPDTATFTADEMRMVVEGFLSEVAVLSGSTGPEHSGGDAR